MATENLAPDVLLSSAGFSSCTNSDLTGIDASFCIAIDNKTATETYNSFSTPSADPITGAGLQTMRCEVRWNGTTGPSTARIEVWESGSLFVAGSEVEVTSATSQIITLDWDATGLSDSSGAGVEVKVFGTNSLVPDKSSVDIGFVEWVVDVGGALDIAPTGIVSAESFGTAVLTTGAVDISPTGIASGEAFGSHTVEVVAGGPTERLRYVNAASSGGDGTTNATSGENAAYASLSACETAEQIAGSNLVSLDEWLHVKCEGTTADTVALNWDGFTTDATRNVVIEGNNLLGVKSSNAYRLEANASGNNQVVEVNDPYVIFRYIQIENTNPSPASNDGAIGFYQTGCEFDNCVFTGGRQVIVSATTGTLKGYRTASYGGSGGGAAMFDSAAGTIELQDCVFIGDTYGVRNFSSSTYTCRNCYAKGNSGFAYTGTIGKTTCASSDSTGSTGLQNIAYSTDTFTNVTTGSEDFTLVSGSALIDEGTDNSGESAPFNYTEDAAGETITTPQDIGTIQLPATGSQDITPTGITSAETFGSATLTTGTVDIAPTAISSAESFGTPVLSSYILPTSISTAESFGVAVISTGTVDIATTGIPSTESFGTAVLTTGVVDINPTGIISTEFFGTAAITTGAVDISPNSIPSEEVFGTAIISTDAVIIFPTAIPSAESFGAAVLTTGEVDISPTGISSKESFGVATITTGVIDILPTGIVSTEAFGSLTLVAGAVNIALTGIPSAETFGTPIISTEEQNISPNSIASAEVFGTAFIRSSLKIQMPIGIPQPNLDFTEDFPATPGDWSSEVAGYYYIDYVTGSDAYTYGTPTNPRKTLPDPIPAGSIVIVADGYNHVVGNVINVVPAGSSGSFVIGVSGKVYIKFLGEFSSNKKTIVKGTYCLIQGGTWNTGSVLQLGSNTDGYAISDVIVRYAEVIGLGTETSNGTGISVAAPNTQGQAEAVNIVLYKNITRNLGDMTLDQDIDQNGIGVSGYSSYVWAIDNELYDNSGAAIQLNPLTPKDASHHIFLGYNHAYNCKQAGIAGKYVKDSVISQNLIHDIIDTSWSPGKCIGLQYDPDNVWIIYNECYNSRFGVRLASSNAPPDPSGYKVFVIGNLLHDLVDDGFGHTGADVWGSNAGIWMANTYNKKVYNNLVYNAENGFATPAAGGEAHIRNNIFLEITNKQLWVELTGALDDYPYDIQTNVFGDAGIDITIGVDDVTTMSAFNTLIGNSTNILNEYFPGGIPAYEVGILDLKYDPIHLNAGTNIDSTDLALFETTFGISLNRGFDNKVVPQGSSIDIGPWEDGTEFIPGTNIIEPAGIASAESFGNPIIATDLQDIAPNSIASAESFGTAVLSTGEVDISPTGIPSAEATGSHIISVGSVDVSPTSISSEESFGTAVLTVGTVNVLPTGIPSAESIGSHVVSLGAGVQYIEPNGIASAESFGTAFLTIYLSPTAIPSAESFGTPVLTTGAVDISPTSIASAEALGSHVLSTGAVDISPTSIASAESFGSHNISTGTVNISVNGIPSDESFGSHVISQGLVISPTGIQSTENFGTAVLSTGVVNIAPTGIVSAEFFGSASLSLDIKPAGIPSEESFGNAALSMNISPTGIASAEVFGSATITTGSVDISVTGIPSAESLGDHVVSVGVTIIAPTSIPSEEEFGSHTITTGIATISPTGISSEESFGVAIIGNGGVVGPVTVLLTSPVIIGEINNPVIVAYITDIEN